MMHVGRRCVHAMAGICDALKVLIMDAAARGGARRR
eukprot:COSAG01_NODE_58874_length_303_cov_1.014706_2_plen_35_part_01